MAINERLIHTAADAAGAASAEQGLILHLDANDVDSYDGDGDIWYDISEYDVTIPLSDNADDLELHLNASDITSYDPATDTTTWTDISGNSNDATLTSLTNTDHDIDNGGFFTLDGSSDFGTVSHNTSIDFSSGGFTAEAWVYHTDSNVNMILDKGTVSRGYGYNLQISSNNLDLRIHATGGTSATIKVLGTETLTANEWNHVVFTVSDLSSSATAITYVNGTQDGTNTADLTTYTNTDDLLIGSAAYNTTDRFDGKIGAVRIYSKALSASEVGQNYRHGRDYIYTDLAGTPFLHYDPANTSSYSGTGTTLTDLAGNNNADLLGGIESGWDEELGNSFPITGSGDGITTSSTVSINPATDGMTIEMWFKIDSDTQNYLFSFDGTLTTGFGLSYRANLDKVMFFYKTGASTNSNISSPTVTLNKWHHLVATTDGSGAQIYLDGEVGDTTTDNAYSVTYNEDLHFGNLYDLAQNSNTDIGQIRFYKGHLTADEVMQNYLFTKNNYPNTNHADLTSLTHNSSGYFTYDSTSDKAVITNGKTKGIVPNSLTDTTTLVWARIHSTTALSYILTGRNQSSSINNFYFRHYNNNLTLAIYDDGGVRDINQNFGSLSANTWYLLGFRTTTDGSARVNVITTGSSTFTDATGTMSSYESTDVDFNIGFYQTNYGFDGDIGVVKVYNKYLSDSEITAYFDATKSTYGL